MFTGIHIKLHSKQKYILTNFKNILNEQEQYFKACPSSIVFFMFYIFCAGPGMYQVCTICYIFFCNIGYYYLSGKNINICNL